MDGHNEFHETITAVATAMGQGIRVVQRHYWWMWLTRWARLTRCLAVWAETGLGAV